MELLSGRNDDQSPRRKIGLVSKSYPLDGMMRSPGRWSVFRLSAKARYNQPYELILRRYNW
jgi:hypothetical protein